MEVNQHFPFQTLASFPLSPSRLGGGVYVTEIRTVVFGSFGGPDL